VGESPRSGFERKYQGKFVDLSAENAGPAVVSQWQFSELCIAKSGIAMRIGRWMVGSRAADRCRGRWWRGRKLTVTNEVAVDSCLKHFRFPIDGSGTKQVVNR
jgi:hypothetical protein